MKESFKNIIKESFEEEVNLQTEWNRLEASINKQRIPVILCRRKRQLSLAFFKYAAAILLGVVITATFSYLSNNTKNSIANFSKVITENSDKSFLELPDGTRIWLNGGTTIEYGHDYGIKNRNVMLNGEAYFEVAKNIKLPFIVNTGGVDVTALGTTFNIQAYKKDIKVTTTLYTGNVKVTPTVSGQKILLKPNEVAVYYKDRNRIEKYPYSGPCKAEWIISDFSFNMVRLIDITKQLEKRYNVTFIYRNQKIKKLRFSGSFQKNESLDDILKVIQTNTDINYKIVKDSVIIN